MSDKSFKPNNSGMRNVFALGLVSFFTDFSTEMVLGLLPLFIVTNLGASRTVLGVIEGSAELISYAFRMISGSLSDKVGKRKIFVVAGYVLSTASKPFFALSTGWLDAFAIRTCDRVGKGLRTAPRDALIADSVSDSISGRAFGVHRTIDQMGAIAGPIAAYALLQVMDIRGIFIVSLIPGLVGVIILIFLVKEIVHKKGSNIRPIISNIAYVIKNNKPFSFVLIISSIFGLGAFNFSFVLLKSSELGVGEDQIPLVYAAINVTHTAVGIPSGILADKIGKEKVLMLGYSIFVVSALLMTILTANYVYAIILAAVFGIYIGILETVQRAIVPRYIPSELRGTAFGIYNLVLGASFFVSNFAFGFLWDNYDLNTATIYSTVMSLTAIMAMGTFVRKYVKVT